MNVATANLAGITGITRRLVLDGALSEADARKALDEGRAGAEGAKNALALLDRLNAVTNLFAPFGEESAPADILEKVMARQQARRQKDFALSDRLRDEVLAAGWVIEDTPSGPRVKRG